MRNVLFFFWVDFAELHKTRMAIRFRAKKKKTIADYPEFCIGVPVVGTDGHSGGRSVYSTRDYQIF